MRCTRELLRAVLVADRLKDFRADGVLSMADWLAYRYNLSPRTAASGCAPPTRSTRCRLLRAQYVAGKVRFEQLMSALSYAQPGDDAVLAELLPGLSCRPGPGHRSAAPQGAGPRPRRGPPYRPASVCEPTVTGLAHASRGSCPPRTPPTSTRPSPAAPKRPDPTPRPVCGHPSTVAWPARCATSAPRTSPRQLPPAHTPTPQSS